MATRAEWIEGARPRTLFLAVAPVAAGTGVAAHDGGVVWVRAVLALVVALALQIGVNYANDYSDGVRGTDADRVGPQRLVGSGAADPGTVLRAALISFAVAAVAGLVLAVLAAWWLVLVGAAAVAAAWFYTGGTRPYGYRALGELAVFVFFGLVAVIGTAYVQTGRITAVAVTAAVPLGLLACALLVANNIRDIPSDTAADKTTLAVVLGDRRSRALYLVLVSAPFVFVVGLSLVGYGPYLAFLAAPLAVVAVRPVAAELTGAALVPTIRATGMLTLAYGVLLGVGLAIGG